MLWPKLDAGLIATNIWTRGHAGLRRKLTSYTHQVNAEVLGLSTRAPSTAVQGELGCLTYENRYGKHILQSFRRLICAPQDTVPALIVMRLMQAVGQGEAPPPYLTLVSQLMQRNGLQWGHFTTTNAKDTINAAIARSAEQEWHAKVRWSTSHSPIYPPGTRLEMREYLTLNAFRGRRLITKLRANDLPLQAAGPEHTKEGSAPAATQKTRPHPTSYSGAPRFKKLERRTVTCSQPL